MKLRIFRGSNTGNVAVVSAIIAPIVIGSAALASDYAQVYSKQAKLQDAADAAAIATARELGISGNDEAKLVAISENYVRSNFYHTLEELADPDELKITTEVAHGRRGIEVTLQYYWQPFLAQYFGTNILPIKVAARANLAGDSSLCALALDITSDRSLYLTGNAQLSAPNCSVQVNSSSNLAIAASSGSKLHTQAICSVGGYIGPTNGFTPIPVTDCPQVHDPLRDRQWLGHNGHCDISALKIDGGYAILHPGSYCGGVLITGGSVVKLNPGVYTFVDGDLDVGGGAEITGNSVNLNFQRNSRFFFRNASTLSLSAPDSGAMAGILVKASAFNDPTLIFEIQSNDAREFTGLVYLPNNTLKLGDDLDGDQVCDPNNDVQRNITDKKTHTHDEGHLHRDGTRHSHPHERGTTYRVGGKLVHADHSHVKFNVSEHNDLPACKTNLGSFSDWTAIIAQKILLTAGVNLVLNSEYTNTSVPLPDNSGVIGDRIFLSE